MWHSFVFWLLKGMSCIFGLPQIGFDLFLFYPTDADPAADRVTVTDGGGVPPDPPVPASGSSGTWPRWGKVRPSPKLENTGTSHSHRLSPNTLADAGLHLNWAPPFGKIGKIQE